LNIFIEPSDVWLFRDARPFAPDERGRAVSLFPPTPRTMQGVIRSLRLAQSGASFEKQSTWPADVGTPNDFGSLLLKGPLIARRHGDGVQRFFPLPRDVVQLKSGWHILAPTSDQEVISNWRAGLRLLLPPENTEPTKFEGGWLCEDGLLAYLKGTVCGVHVHPANTFFLHEPRVGVEIDSFAKRPVEENLYQIEFVRLQQDTGLLVEAHGISLEQKGLLQLGGEARGGRYQKVTSGTDLSREDRFKDGEPLRFKLYFATPAIFKHGWLPEAVQFNGSAIQGIWRGISLTLVAAAVGRWQPIGGRDITPNGSQRAIRGAVPAGSVYFLESDAKANDVLSEFDGQCVSDVDGQIGFGLCYVGGW